MEILTPHSDDDKAIAGYAQYAAQMWGKALTPQQAAQMVAALRQNQRHDDMVDRLVGRES